MLQRHLRLGSQVTSFISAVLTMVKRFIEIWGYIFSGRATRLYNPLTRIHKRSTGDGLYSVGEFRTIVERECARADRTGSLFSIVAFDVYRTDEEDGTTVRRLSKALNHRARLTDEVGWFDKERLGVILPCTSGAGANKLAEDVCQGIGVWGPPPFFKVYTYPSEWSHGPKKNMPSHSHPERRNNRGIPPSTQNDKVELQNYLSLEERLDPFLGRPMPVWKRGIDILGSVLALVLLFPLLLFIAIFIKAVSPGPVFYRGERVGYLGENFKCWKFRTMHPDSHTSSHEEHVIKLMKCDNAPFEKLDDEDLRIIPFGGLLRKTGLDELPQLLNVLQGEMSLVGPRPELPYSVQHYTHWQKRRFDVVPGLTGLWQVNGKNRTTFRQMIRWDIAYIQQRSFWLDLKVIVKTTPAIVTQAFNSYFKKSQETALLSEHPIK